MSNLLLGGLVDSVLGQGIDRKSTGDRKYYCPFCNHHKPKLEVQLNTNNEGENPWGCWTCQERGKTIRSLFRKLKVGPDLMSKLNDIVKTNKGSYIKREKGNVELPKEFKSLLSVTDKDISGRHALVYATRDRSLTEYDILKYNIGYCASGEYEDMIIIPSYDENNQLNFFVARKCDDQDKFPYKNPDVSKDIIPFGQFINWNVPVNLCEGFFDLSAIKRNCIPLLGKMIPDALMKKLVMPNVKNIFISLDKDALKQALAQAELLLSYGKKLYLVELEDKDPGKMGFEEYTKLVQKAKPLTLSKIMSLKLKLAYA